MTPEKPSLPSYRPIFNIFSEVQDSSRTSVFTQPILPESSISCTKPCLGCPSRIKVTHVRAVIVFHTDSDAFLRRKGPELCIIRAHGHSNIARHRLRIYDSLPVDSEDPNPVVSDISTGHSIGKSTGGRSFCVKGKERAWGNISSRSPTTPTPRCRPACTTTVSLCFAVSRSSVPSRPFAQSPLLQYHHHIQEHYHG